MIGHDKVTKAFPALKDMRGGSILFVGPSSVGKATAALELAKYIIGTKLDQNPDIITVRPKKTGLKVIPIDAIRNLVKEFDRPALAHTKVFIIEDFDRATTGATNAFLKSLEETKDYTVILTAPDIKVLLPTIVSRCMVFTFSTVDTKDIYEAIEWDYGIDPLLAEYIANISQGLPGKAINYCLNPELLEEYELHTKIFTGLIGQNLITIFKQSEAIAKDKNDAINFMESVCLFLALCLKRDKFDIVNKKDIKKSKVKKPKELVDQSELKINYALTALNPIRLRELFLKAVEVKNNFSVPVNTRLNIDTFLMRLR